MNKFSISKEPKTATNSNTDQEFSFPVMSSLSSNPSSSLWRISSRVYHHQLDDEQQQQEQDEDSVEDDDHYMEVRSMCDFEEGRSPNRRSSSLEIYECSSCQGEELQIIMQEERMDFLWQDFNEEDKLKDVVNHKVAANYKESGYLQRSKTRIRRMGRRSSSPSNSTSKMMMMGKLFKGLLSFKKTRF